MADGCTNLNDDLMNIATGTTAQQLQTIINTAEGIGAAITGEPYSVYRITATSNGDFIQTANLIASNMFVQRQKMPPADPGLLSAAKDMTLFLQVMGDFNNINVGDVFVLVNSVGKEVVTFPTPQYVGFASTGQIPLLNKNAARLDRQIIIKRPSNKARPDGIADQSSKNADVMKFINGKLTKLSHGARASLIPAGFRQISRPRGSLYSHVPDTAAHTQWSCYVPPLPGFTFQENDIIIEAYLDPQSALLPPKTQARYRVVNPFYQDVDCVGYQLLIEREVSSHGE